jgi:pimeloyl-ACP methyl ester carboxylesterase
MPPTTSRSRSIVIDGEVPIHARIHAGAGPALVLIHGITSSGEVWSPVIEPLGAAFTPVTIDLRGHGASGKPPRGYLYDDYIDDLDRAFDALGLERPLIAGHSLGGLVALWWAARHPERAPALVIEDSPLRSGEDFRPAFEGWLRLNAMPLDELRGAYAAERPHWKPEAVDARARQMHQTARPVIEELMADSMANHGVDRLAEIEHVTSPVLFIHGDLDAGGMVHPDDIVALEQRLPNATVRRIPRGSHSMHIETPRAFLELAMPFLQRHAGDASHIETESP